MWRAIVLAVVFSVAASGTIAATAQGKPRTPSVQGAADGIFAAFRQHPIVMLGDAHHLAQEGAFYAALVRDPRFAEEVGNLVVEFGGAAHQDTVNRYVNGENVPYAELRRVWTDVVGWEAPPSQMYTKLLATVRAVNSRLPPARRIVVWLGEPPIDWAKVHSFDDLDPYMRERDSYPADLINHSILDRGRRALVIYGWPHFLPPRPSDSPFGLNMRDRVEREHPGSTYVVYPYAGFSGSSCTRRFERLASNWKAPALVAPLSGSSLGSLTFRCLPAVGVHPSDASAAARIIRALSRATVDGVLYLGPADTLLHDADNPDLFMDPAYVAEWNRERACCFPPEIATIDADKVLRENTTVPRRYETR